MGFKHNTLPILQQNSDQTATFSNAATSEIKVAKRTNKQTKKKRAPAYTECCYQLYN